MFGTLQMRGKVNIYREREREYKIDTDFIFHPIFYGKWNPLFTRTFSHFHFSLYQTLKFCRLRERCGPHIYKLGRISFSTRFFHGKWKSPIQAYTLHYLYHFPFPLIFHESKQQKGSYLGIRFSFPLLFYRFQNTR